MNDLVETQNEVMIQIDIDPNGHKKFPFYLDLERRGFPENIQRLLDPFETRNKQTVHGQIEACRKVLSVIKDNPDEAKEIARALGFDKLVKGDRFQVEEGENRILGKFGNLVDSNPGVHSTPLAMVFGVISNGMPQREAEILLDEITKTKNGPVPKDETLLQWAFRAETPSHILRLAHAPQWAKEKYGKM